VGKKLGVAAGATRRDRAPAAKETWQPPEPAVAGQSVAGRGAAVAADPEAQAAILMRATGGRPARAGGMLLRWQQEVGNRYVGQVARHAAGTVRPAPAVRAGLVLGQPRDRYEQEADQVAGQLAGPAGHRPAAGHGGTRAGAVDPLIERAIRGARAGRPLPDGVRAPLEGLLGADLPRVRIHTDTRADLLAQALGARAFTTGREIFFRRGEYRPGSQAGQRLLAHELTHTVQQTATAPTATAGVVQRVMIDGKDTENPDDLQALIKLAQAMNSPQDIDEMLAKANRANAGRGSVEDGLEKLLTKLKLRRKVLAYKQTLVPRGQSASAQPLAPAPEVPAKHPAARLEPAAEVNRMESLTAEATTLAEWGARLDRGPGAGAAEAWSKEIDAFRKAFDAWTGQLEAAPMTPVERRRLAKPLREYSFGLLNKQMTHRETAQEQEHQEKEQAQALRSQREAAAIADAQTQVAAGQAAITPYIGTLDITVDSQQVSQPPDSIPGLFVVWIFTSAIGQAVARSANDPSVAGLLGQLQERKTAGGGLLTMVAGSTTYQRAAGQGNKDFVRIVIRMPDVPLKLLVGDDRQDRADRNALVTETASSFIHEAAHSLQEFVYKNGSYPWRDRPEISSVTYGVRPKDLPGDVGPALREFEGGGRAGQASEDPDWVRFSKLLHNEQYYIPPVPIPPVPAPQPETGGSARRPPVKPPEPPRNKDFRSKEIVSYLVELRFAWNDEARFRRIFPEGTSLLHRVITQRL
jgi:hypothetical protein